MTSSVIDVMPRDATSPAAAEASPQVADPELLRCFLAHRDETAFARLVERHGRTVWGVCRRVLQHQQDTEDAFQAVFIILARKAAAIRQGEAVGSWLYSVAYRTAMKARRQREGRGGGSRDEGRGASERVEPMSCSEDSPWGQAACRELQRMLDEELHRLAEKLRAPFVLCCLEGMSKSEAAKELGWKEGTVSGRLAQARKLLHSRLARRGVTLSAVLTAGVLAQGSAAAAAPPLLMAAAVKAVAAPLATKSAAAALSPAAVNLAEGLIHTMAVAKVKAGVSLVLAVSIMVAGAGVVALQEAPQPPAVEDKAEIETMPSSDPETFLLPGTPLWQTNDERVLTVAFAPDGKKLITGGARYTLPGQLKIWDVSSSKPLATVKGISGVRSVAFAPQGDAFATGDFSGMVKLRDAETGKELAAVMGHPGDQAAKLITGVNSVAFSADGTLLVSAGLDKIVKLWNVPKITEAKAFHGHTKMVFSVAFFKHGKAIVSGGEDGVAKIWDIGSGKEKFTLEGHKSAVETVAVSPDDKIVATASWDGSVKLWDAGTGKETATLQGNEASILFLAFSPNGELLAGGGVDGAVCLWDAKTHKVVANLRGHAAQVWSVTFSRDGKSLASGSEDKTAKLWNVAEKKETARLVHADQKPILAMAYASDGKAVAVAEDTVVRLRDAKTGDVLHHLKGHDASVMCLAFSPDGQTVASGSDKTVKIWNRATGKEKHTLNGHTGIVRALAFSADGKKLASGGDDNMIRLWDPDSAKTLSTIEANQAAIHALAMAADNRMLASGGDDGTIKLWDVSKDGEPAAIKAHEGKAHDGAVRALTFALHGALASGGDDGVVKVWTPGKGTMSVNLQGHRGPIWALAFTSGSRTLVSGGVDRNVYIWDPIRGQSRGVLRGHAQRISALAIHPSGDHLLSASYDATVLRWNAVRAAAPTAQAITLQGNPKGVWFVQYSPAGDRLVSGGQGGGVTLWSRSLTPAEFPFRARGGAYWDAAFSPDRQTFAVGSQRELVIFDAVTGQVKRRIVFGQSVCTVAYSPNSKYIAAGTGNWQNPDAVPECRLFDAATGEELAKLTGHEQRILRIRFSPDGKLLASSSRDKTIRLWEVPSGNPKGVLTQPKSPVKGMVFLPDGALVSAGYDSVIRFWNVESGKETKVKNAGMVLASLAASPDGTLLAAAESAAENKGDGAAPLKIWDVATGKELLKLEGHGSRILGLSFTPDGRGLVTAGGKSGAYGEINYWDLISGKLRATHKTANNWMENAVVSPDGRRVLSASVAGLHAWNLDFTHAERTWNAHTNIASCGLFLDGGRVLATGGWDQVVNLWDVRKGIAIATCKGHKNGIRCLAVLNDGKTLVSGGEDKTIKLWDWATGAEKATLQGNTGIVYALAVSPDGKTLASGGGNHREAVPGELILWDIEAGKPRKTIAGIEHAVMSLAYSPDGTLLAGSVSSGLLKVWDAKTGELRKTFAMAHVRPVAFSPDGKLLIAAGGKAPSANGPGAARVRVWDTVTWKERPALQGHNHVIFSVSASPDGVAVASAGEDGTVKLWSMPGAQALSPSAVPLIAAKAKEAMPAVAMNRLIGTGDPTGQAAEKATDTSTISWKVWLAIAIATVLAIVSGLGLWRVRYSRRTANNPTTTSARGDHGFVGLSCSNCGKHLKAKAELAGKKVKCPQCGKTALVPDASVHEKTGVPPP